MSYSNSHHQFGHNDMQLIQNRVMVARLQELQKQQQHGQLGDSNSQSPMTTHLSRFGQQASGGQTPNPGVGMALNSSNIFAPNNMNWVHHGFSNNPYLHDQGVTMNPSFYGTPVASGRANMGGHYSPLQGIPQTFLGPSSVDSEQKRYVNSLFGDDTNFDYSEIHRQPSGGTTELDPLEEKILFDTENSGWDSSLSKLAALDVEEYENSSGVTETMNQFSTLQSGSWSALMQSAVADVSSGDTGVQEELSGLSYQNIELSTDNKPSNLLPGKSSSYSLKTPPSSCDSIMSSAFPSFQHTGLQPSFEQGSNIEQWSHLSQSFQNQQQLNERVVSISDINRNVYGQIQHRTCDSQYMSIADGASNQKEDENKSLRYDDTPVENGHMSVDTGNKNAGQTYGSQNYLGENSSDSYNSKVSHAYTAQPDSESSARSSQKSPNQPLSLSYRGAESQQECFSSIKSDDVLHTNIGSAIQVKHNELEDALSKRSPASNFSASMDSKNTPNNKANLVSDPRGTQTERGSSQDIFSFQSSMFGDSIPTNLGNEQKGQTWWMPSSFGPSHPSLQGALAHNLSETSSKLGFEIPNQLEHKSISNMSVPSEQVGCLLEKTLPYMSHLNQLGMNPYSSQMSLSSQRDVIVDPCNNSEIGEGQPEKARFDERKSSQNRGGEIFESVKKSEMRFGDASMYLEGSSYNFGYDVISDLKTGGHISSDFYNQCEGGKKAPILSPFDSVDDGMKTVINQQVLSSSMLCANADNVNLILGKSRKRKFSTYSGLPWHVEVMQASWKLPDISVAEQGWAKATNRLVEERVNENDTLEEIHPIARSKKRLISTSQLMQQLFRPPASSILRVDATSNYELFVYFVSKVSLADICKLISQYGDMLINASSNVRNSVMKDAEVLVERAMKLESLIEGLNERFSTADIRRECQELEKFNLINHFAKYHGRLAQSNSTDIQSPFLQKYVSPTPVPQIFPQGTKCLSL